MINAFRPIIYTCNCNTDAVFYELFSFGSHVYCFRGKVIGLRKKSDVQGYTSFGFNLDMSKAVAE